MFGKEVGMTDEQLDSIKDWVNSNAFNGVEQAVLRFTDEVAKDARVKDDTFSALAKHMDEGMMVELTQTVGFYGMLARMLLRRYSAGNGLSFDAAALDAMSRHRWPGNVRELQNAVRYAAAVARSEVVTLDDLPETVRPDSEESAPTPYRDLLESPYGEARASFISQFERLYVRHRMEQAGGSLTKAAKLAGMDRANFRRLAKRAGASSGQAGAD